ncbi:PREDICTED: translation initiation factor eIF-2B subunit alpha isoform X1 [Poecilia mexicana]|uniref:translation initiation factor eIF-2B subunit alpha isoform X1 n=1 Tax=Poecilia mexicana TaxID=48701 RepID=UPI00072DC3C4|nr:PREDICTED: translation initiation factor eIF-2B subunit alpha isoform X1 [Poecilia mexicana]
MNEEELVEYFRAQMRKDPDMASAVAAIRTLLEFLKRDKGETILGLRESLTWATACLMGEDSSVAVSSGGELFLRFISLTSLEHQDLSRCKKVMEERGELFLEKISMSRNKVAKLCHTFIKDGAKILTHSYSRVVLRVLEKAAAEKKRFSVYVTESQPDAAGRQMAEALKKLNVPVTVVLDAAVGYVLEKVDLVIVGAEGVVESGGIINKIGTYQMAMCSKAHNKPFYVVAESFKFVRLYPLNQQDVPDKFKVRLTYFVCFYFNDFPSLYPDLLTCASCPAQYKADTLKSIRNLSEEHPVIDYTPPSLITLLFTDLGVLTPSAVSDELIKLYL